MEALEQYRVNLEAYAGPLDLLLYLVRKNEVDITHISLARVAGDYLKCVELLTRLNMEVAGEFLVIAATLMEIKSRTLLPVPPVEEDEEWEDPCAEFVHQLIEYRRFKEAAGSLEDRAEERAKMFARTGEKPPADEAAPEEELREVSVWDLLEAFGKILEATGGAQRLEITVDSTPQKDVMDQILARLAAEAAAGRPAEVTLTQLVKEHNATRGRLINLFLSILELVKEGIVRALQHQAFGEIYLIRRTSPAPKATTPASSEGAETAPQAPSPASDAPPAPASQVES